MGGWDENNMPGIVLIAVRSVFSPSEPVSLDKDDLRWTSSDNL